MDTRSRWPTWRWALTGRFPPINITRSDGGIRVEALCRGVDRESLDIEAVGDTVTLRGSAPTRVSNPSSSTRRMSWRQPTVEPGDQPLGLYRCLRK
jgi:HSP20 family molecular chaperone IbpA